MGKVGKIMKGIGKKVGNKIGSPLVDVAPDKQNALYQKLWNKKLNPKIGYGLAGAAAIGGIGWSASKAKNRHNLGYMSAQDGPLSNMIGGATLSPLVQQTQSGEYDANKTNNNITSMGADGDIVFALHNMR